MASITPEDILLQVPLCNLQEKFFEHYNSLSYVSELFEMIEADKLAEWIINQFIRDFPIKQLREMFEYE